jgi:cytochrome P450
MTNEVVMTDPNYSPAPEPATTQRPAAHLTRVHGGLGARRVEVPGPAGALETAACTMGLLADPLSATARCFARYGDLFRIRRGRGWLYFVRHPDHVRDVLLTQAAAFTKEHSLTERLRDVVGDSLLTSNGEDWRRHRRLLQPAFARPRLVEYAALMADEAARECGRLSGQRRVDLDRELKTLTQRIVTRTLFGTSMEDDPETRGAMQYLSRWFVTPAWLLAITPGARARFGRERGRLDRFVDSIVATASDKDTEGSSHLLAALLRLRDDDGAALSPKELRDHLITLYLAGHETTSYALTWTFYLLSRNPLAARTLRHELARVLGGRTPRFDDLPKLPYTQRVLQEAMRLYPPVYVMPRRACRDASIGEHPVERGSEVLVWNYFTQRDPRFYDEPERFEPERFEQVEPPRGSYLPFGVGQRACIGQTFAMLEAQLVLATLAPRFELRYAATREPRLRLGVTLKPARGMPMELRPIASDCT